MRSGKNPTLPGTLTLRGVQVRKQREGEVMRFTAIGPAGTLITTCPVRVAWKIINLLVDAAEKQITACPQCGTAKRSN